MVRVDGCYLGDGTPFLERGKDNPWYGFLAYLFLHNGKVIKAFKFSKNQYPIIFNRLDFKKENSNGLYQFEDNQLIIQWDRDKIWESKEHFKKSEIDTFRMKSGRKIVFKLFID